MIILVDMDNVIVEFEKSVIEFLNKERPEKKDVFERERKKFKISDEHPDMKSIIKERVAEKGFTLNLIPVKGSIEALKEIEDMGHKVFICTSPLTRYENNVLEKYMWVEKNMGHEWTKKMILTKDKTLLKGDILIDDKPEIEGVENPNWEHIIFDRSYNKHIKDKKRITWDNWKEVLDIN